MDYFNVMAAYCPVDPVCVLGGTHTGSTGQYAAITLLESIWTSTEEEKAPNCSSF
jgi:hypothetical protein